MEADDQTQDLSALDADALVAAVIADVVGVLAEGAHAVGGDSGVAQVQPVRGTRLHVGDHGNARVHLCGDFHHRVHDVGCQR